MTTHIISSMVISFVLGFASFKILDLIYQEKNVPYIDEIFHVHQAQQYCNNNWLEWHPKITTFPGLYITAISILKPLEYLGYENFCSLYALRSTNIIATILNFVLSIHIIMALEEKYKMKSHTILKLFSALNIALFPPLYFFTFFFYTDVWSTTFVLLMYCLYLSKDNFSELSVGLACCMAVLMRQTNIIWVGLILFDSAWEIITEEMLQGGMVQNFKTTQKILQKLFSTVSNSQSKNKQKSLNLMGLISIIISESYHLILVCVAFLCVVIYNGSIVLGDKAAHAPILHPMQNLYFLNFAIFFGLPFALSEVLSLWKKPPNIFLVVLLAGLCAALSEFNKVEHPYLLADNRHLAFYAWKRFFGHERIRRVLIPTYIVSGFLFFRILKKRCHLMFAIVLFACIVCNLTFQHLFEFRYFIIPFLMWRLQLKPNLFVLLETVFFTVINAFVIYLFLYKPFSWPSEPGVHQRFIW